MMGSNEIVSKRGDRTLDIAVYMTKFGAVNPYSTSIMSIVVALMLKTFHPDQFQQIGNRIYAGAVKRVEDEALNFIKGMRQSMEFKSPDGSTI